MKTVIVIDNIFIRVYRYTDNRYIPIQPLALDLPGSQSALTLT